MPYRIGEDGGSGARTDERADERADGGGDPRGEMRGWRSGVRGLECGARAEADCCRPRGGRVGGSLGRVGTPRAPAGPQALET